MPTVKANGITIEYEALGEQSAPPVLLIMGLGMQLIAWPDTFCQGLVSAGYRVIRFDNRDCGLSTRLDALGVPNLLGVTLRHLLRLPVRAPYQLGDMAADTVALLDAVGARKAHVVGVSMGGMIGQVLAARWPERVLSFTSIMSSSGNRRLPGARLDARRAHLRRPANPHDPDSVVDNLVSLFRTIGSPGFPTDQAELRARLSRAVRRAYAPGGTARQLTAVIASGDRRALLRTIRAPTLVIHGAHDPLVPVEAGHDTARNIPGAKLKIVEGMGHDLAPGLVPVWLEAIVPHCRAVRGP